MSNIIINLLEYIGGKGKGEEGRGKRRDKRKKGPGPGPGPGLDFKKFKIRNKLAMEWVMDE